MRRERLVDCARCIVLLACSALPLSCDDKPFDWCTEAREDDTVRASGTVSIRYRQDASADPVTVEVAPHVRQEGGALTVQGCGKHGADLWRWRGVFQGLEPGGGQTVRAAGDGATYGGEVRYCKGGSCTEGKVQQVVVAHGTASVAGTVDDYEPSEALLRSTLELSDTPGESVRIEIDIQWDPAP